MENANKLLDKIDALITQIGELEMAGAGNVTVGETDLWMDLRAAVDKLRQELNIAEMDTEDGERNAAN